MGRAVVGPSAVFRRPITALRTTVRGPVMSDAEDSVRVHNGEVEVGESGMSGEKPSEKCKKVGENGMGEENIEITGENCEEENVKEVSKIGDAQGKTAEVEVGESEVSGEKPSDKYKKVGEKGMGEENIETIGRSGGEENVKEVSEAQSKTAELRETAEG